MRNKGFICCLWAIVLCLPATHALARADKTDYPVIFAHGMLGFDEVVGLDYFGNDYGVFVGDPCDQFLETSCNENIDRNQEAYAPQVNPFQSSEYRGIQLADEIEGYMATVGADCVNIIGHSQGGLDSRKAAKLLYDRKGYQVVKALISLSSPHRGSPVAGNVLYKGEDNVVNIFAEWLASYGLSPLFSGEEGDYMASMKSFFYDDWDPGDGELTGSKVFNNNYPINNTWVKYYGSLITSEQGGFGAVLLFMGLLAPLDIDGDGWCGETDQNGDLLDCNADGAAGEGDGDFEDGDDDGLVGLNSQQMGFRLSYEQAGWFAMRFAEDPTTGYVDNLNHPGEIQSTSYSSVLPEDHLDVCGMGVIPYVIEDQFDEMQFYADLIDYIANLE